MESTGRRADQEKQTHFITQELGRSAGTQPVPCAWISKHADSLALFVCAFVLCILLAGQITYMLELDNKLSGIADPISEGRGLRAGRSYAERGFWVDYGLPDIDYGLPNLSYGSPVTERWRNSGPNQPRVYTHYPPGPDLIAGVLTRTFGAQNVNLFRIFPLFIGVLSIGFFCRKLTRVFGNIRGTAIFLGCAVVPMFSNMMHGMHHQSYTFALLLVQLCILIDFLGDRVPSSRSAFAALGVIGFLQGWFSFDYFFLVSFAAIPFWLLGRCMGRVLSIGSLAACICASILGFALAHGLHFVQVIMFYGSFERAITDMSAASRFSTAGPFGVLIVGRLDLLYQYARILSGDPRYFSYALSCIVVISCFLLAFNRGGFLGWLRPAPWIVHWNVDRRSFAAIGSALAVSALWISVLPFHGICHTHFLPRHFFLPYFVGIIILVHSVNVKPGQDVILLRQEG